MAQDLFLGIDIGTGGVRACAIDGDARIIGAAATGLPSPRQDGDAIDQNPELWWNAVVETIGRLGESLDLSAIKHISVDGTSGTLLLTDGDGTPLTPGLMYNDARAGAEASRIGGIAPAESGPMAAAARWRSCCICWRAAARKRRMRCIRPIGSPAGWSGGSTAATRTTR
jgi:D-ribulokinase